MLQQYFTLYHIAAELNVLRGCTLTEAFTQFKGTAILQFEDDERRGVVECSFDPKLTSIFLKPQFARARRNSMDLFKPLIGQQLRSVRIPAYERNLIFKFEDSHLIANMYSAGRGDLVMTNREHQVVGTFRNSGHDSQTTLNPQPREIGEFTDAHQGERLARALALTLQLTGKYYQQELFRRLNLAPRSTVGDYSSDELQTIQLEASKIREACLNTSTFYLQNTTDGTPLLSMIKLRDDAEEFDGISEAILQRIIRTRRMQRAQNKRQSIEKILNKLEGKVERAISNLESETIGAQRAQKRRLFAELIMARGDLHKKGQTEIILEDWEFQPHTITLDPAKSLLENAQEYFDKARKSVQAAEIRERRYFQYVERQERLAAARAQFDAAQSDEQLDTLRKDFPDIFPVMRTNKQALDDSRYRRFELGDGFTLYVGRNSANNDELTMRFARPNDYWFHARGVSGSHAVLKGGDGKSKPPKYILEAAAGIAAYYSKSRNAGLTPVVYTQKKYIRKPRGAAQGAVTLERETVIMTRPNVPEGNEGQE